MEPAVSSTYRLQFSPEFRFADAERIVPYLARLGVSAMYASPYFRARSGSTHGYDVVDHNELNPEVGTPQEHRSMIDAALRHGLAHVLDFVPNHMGVAWVNPWWNDVLEWGERSPYAKFFDIDWHPQRSDLGGKVLLPFLGDHYGRVLERGEIGLAFDADTGSFHFSYYDRRFPLRPSSYAPVLVMASDLCVPPESERLAALAQNFATILPALETSVDVNTLRERAGELKAELATFAREQPAVLRAVQLSVQGWCVDPEDVSSVERLEALLLRQHYRLAFWRVSLYEINYRRFFDINDLAGLRVEDATVLGETHRLLFELIDQGCVQGVRIDHIDGLFNPGAYCRYVRDRTSLTGAPIYFVVEKILARFERLRQDWDVDGTTGYDFMNVVNGLFVNARSELTFDRIYADYAPTDETYEAIVYASKQHIIRNKLASELTVLADRLFKIARMDRRSNDFTYDGLRDALAALVASFPVYRTYVTGEGCDAQDRGFIETATTLARKRSEILDDSVFDFLQEVLTLEVPGEPGTRYDADEILQFTMKFQQFTGPVMAKAVEDTAFYRYVRLLSLNEVGGDPRRFGSSVSAFHHHNQEAAQHFPRTMLATATHDHKRGEDTRLRIDALSEMPGRLRRAVRLFARIAGRAYVDSEEAPSANDLYALFQTIVGSWPADRLDGEMSTPELEAYVQRLEAWIVKAIREAKLHSSWTNPNEPYESAAQAAVRRVFEGPKFGVFLRELVPLIRDAATVAMISSLAQTTLKLASPGVPDIYQGCELWDLSLVDPDNRRPVDFSLRERLLAEICAGFERDGAAFARHLFAHWEDGRVKLFLTWRLLQMRKEYAQALLSADYRRLAARGPRADRLVAFARGEVIVAVPRLVYPLLRLDESGRPAVRFTTEHLVLPKRSPRQYVNVLTDTVLDAGPMDRQPSLSVRELFADIPVAVLVPASSP